MKKQELLGKGIADLRTLAKQAGITAKRDWKKDDFIEALSGKKAPRIKQAKTITKAPAPAKKTAPKKVTTKKPAAKKTEQVKEKKTAPEKAITIKKPAPGKAASKKAETKKTAKVAKKTAVAKAAPKKEAKKAVKKAPVTTKKRAATVKKTPKTVKAVKKQLALPSEYKEDKIVSMPVSPGKIYTYWEITEDVMSQYRGSLNLKISNLATKAFFYLPISERIGEQFITVNADSEHIVEAGVINYKGEFVRIVQPRSVKIPEPPPLSLMGISGAPEALELIILAEGIMLPKIRREEAQGAFESVILPEEFFLVPTTVSSY